MSNLLARLPLTSGFGFAANVIVSLSNVVSDGTSLGPFLANALPTGVTLQHPGSAEAFSFVESLAPGHYQASVKLNHNIRVDCSGAASTKIIIVPFLYIGTTVDPAYADLSGRIDTTNIYISERSDNIINTFVPISLDFNTNGAFKGGGVSGSQELQFDFFVGSASTFYSRLGFFSFLPRFQYGTVGNSTTNLSALNYQYSYKMDIVPIASPLVSVSNTPSVTISGTPDIHVTNTVNTAVTNTPTVVVSGTIPISTNYPINVKVMYE